jgi:hypothetical protein
MTVERWKELSRLVEDRAGYIEHDPALIEALRECLGAIEDYRDQNGLLSRAITRLNAEWAVRLEQDEADG